MLNSVFVDPEKDENQITCNIGCASDIDVKLAHQGKTEEIFSIN